MAAADDDGLALKFGIVAFLHRGIEGIAIHMGNAEIPQLRVSRHARTGAGGTAAGIIELGQAIAAECGHGGDCDLLLDIYS